MGSIPDEDAKMQKNQKDIKMDLSKLNLNWNQADNLIPAIVQDFQSKDILMFAFVNQQSLQETIKSGYATYWSRSRKKLWKKGEDSGHLQKIVNIFTDCDNDALIFQVEQIGGIACHTGRKSCFYKELSPIIEWRERKDLPILKNPKEIYKK